MNPGLLLGALLAVSAGAEVTASLDLSGERLSRSGSEAWFDGSSGLLWREAKFEIGGSWREVRRYGMRDAEGRLQAGWKLGETHFHGEGTVGSESLFLPKGSLQLGIDRPWGMGFASLLQWKQSHYAGLDAGNGLLQLELYRGAWHGGVGAEWVRVMDGPQSLGWRVLLDRAWSERSGAGATLSRSSEFERAGLQVKETQVTGASVFLRQEVSSRTLLRGNLTWADQGGLYRRVGGGIGIEIRVGN